jgi:hypothetical protein
MELRTASQATTLVLESIYHKLKLTQTRCWIESQLQFSLNASYNLGQEPAKIDNNSHFLVINTIKFHMGE